MELFECFLSNNFSELVVFLESNLVSESLSFGWVLFVYEVLIFVILSMSDDRE